jgi:hypothetical protein
MKRTIHKYALGGLLCVGLLASGATAFAQDRAGHESAQQTQSQDEYSSTAPDQSTTTSTTTTTSRSDSSSSSKHRVMKDCVARERAGDSTMSESAARKACHDALKAQNDNQDNEPRPQ